MAVRSGGGTTLVAWQDNSGSHSLDLNIAFPKKMKTLTGIHSIDRGLTHWAWELEYPEEHKYLRIRGDRFRRIPKITCLQQDVQIEAEYLELLRENSFMMGPLVIHLATKPALMILSDVKGKGGRYIDDILNSEGIDSEQIARSAETLSALHTAGRTFTSDPREGKNEEFYIKNLQYRIILSGGENFRPLVNEMGREKRTCVHGDACPKNMSWTVDHSISLFDFDNAHRGNFQFDLGYFLGHFLLHSHYNAIHNAALIDTFIAHYSYENAANDRNRFIIQHTALASILYRLDNPVIPYELPLSPSERSSWANKLRQAALIEHADWRSFCQLVKNAQD